MRKSIVLICVGFCCAVNAANLSKNVDDDSEQSGDFELGVNQFKVHHSDSSASSSTESDIVDAISNIHQQHQNGKQTQKPTNGNERSTPKGKPLSRRADLNDDVNDFVDLIPKAEIKAKLEEYYRNDIDIQHIFEYMHGKEFLELRKNVLDNSDVKDIFQYLNKNGLNIKSVLRKIDNRLGISKVRSAQQLSQLQQQQEQLLQQQQKQPPTQFGKQCHMAIEKNYICLLVRRSNVSYFIQLISPLGTNTTIGGLNGLIEDVLALLPQDEIFILFFEKLDSSPKFATFVQSIGDASFHRKYLTLWVSIIMARHCLNILN